MTRTKISWKGKLAPQLSHRLSTPPRIRPNTIKSRSPGIYKPKEIDDMSFGDAHGDHEGFRGRHRSPVKFPNMDEFATKLKGGRRTRRKLRKSRKTRKSKKCKPQLLFSWYLLIG